MEKKPFIVHTDDAEIFYPAKHLHTVSRRLISQENVGAKFMEVALTKIEVNGMAEEHYHDTVEQAFFLLEGKCLVEVDGEEEELKAGDIAFFTPPRRHKIVPVGGPIKAVVIFAPPLGATTADSFKS
ncbi:cupin domain-containing protein [Chloroflexota bacterium]